MMAGVELTQRAIREQMASAIDVIVHQSRLKDGSRRLTHITEVQGMEGDVVVLQDVFLFDFHAGIDEFGRPRGGLRPTGSAPDVPEPPGRPRSPGTAGSLSAAGLPRMSVVSWSLAGGLGAIFAALFIFAVTVFGSLARSGQGRDLAGRIARYGPRHGTRPAVSDPGAARKAGSVAFDVTKRLMSPAAEQRLAGRLELAGVARKPAEWVLLGGCVAVVIAAAVSVLTGNVIIGVLVGALVGWLSMRTAAELPDPPASRRIRRATAGPVAASCQLTSVRFLAAAGAGRGRARDCPARRRGVRPRPGGSPARSRPRGLPGDSRGPDGL